MSKRSQWISVDFDVKKVLPVLQYNSVPTEASHKPSTPISKKIPFNYFEKVIPQNVTDLAVHSKKITEVEGWLQNYVINNNDKSSTSLLLITGPTGSGKTATVNSLCKKLSIKVMEWVNPIDQYDVIADSGQLSKFLEFLEQTKFSSLLDNNKKKVALIEDFPHFAIHDPQKFHTVLLTICEKSKSPVIFICAEGGKCLNLSRRLFPAEHRKYYKITDITFNAASDTLITNALKRVQLIVKERLDLFKIPSNEVVEAIKLTSCGDIRSAMNQYFFACSKGSNNLEIKLLENNDNVSVGNKRKRSRKSNAKLKNMNKDETLTLFHGIGRILNPKYVEKEDGSSRLNCDFNSLITTFSPNPKMCVAFLHNNYMKYFGDFEDVTKCADVISLAQTFFDFWSEEYDKITIYGLWIAILGCMVHNKHKVSKWNQITAPLNNSKNSLVKKTKADLDVFYRHIITKTA